MQKRSSTSSRAKGRRCGSGQEARELDKGHALTLGVLDMCIAALGLADHPERVTALRNRIQELQSIEENH